MSMTDKGSQNSTMTMEEASHKILLCNLDWEFAETARGRHRKKFATASVAIDRAQREDKTAV
jgi:hypothetical protein